MKISPNGSSIENSKALHDVSVANSIEKVKFFAFFVGLLVDKIFKWRNDSNYVQGWAMVVLQVEVVVAF